MLQTIWDKFHALANTIGLSIPFSPVWYYISLWTSNFFSEPAVTLVSFLVFLDFLAGSLYAIKDPSREWTCKEARTSTFGKMTVWIFWLLVAHVLRVFNLNLAASQ